MTHDASEATALQSAQDGWRSAPAGVHLLVSLLAGGIVGSVTVPLLGWATAGLIAWVAAALVFLIWTWASLWSLGAEDTPRVAAREEGSRPVRAVAPIAFSTRTMMRAAP